MERRAGYFVVGLFVLLFGAGLLVFAVWLAKHQLESDLARYDIIYDGSVTGLKQGGSVRFSGVSVGEVTAVKLFEEDPNKVRVTIEIDRLTPVNSDTRATLELEGITGGRYILLTGGGGDAAPLVPPGPRQLPRIPATASSFDQLLEGAPEVVDSVKELLGRANQLLSDRNRAYITGILSDIAVISHTLASNSDQIEELVLDGAATMENVRQASQSIAGLTQSLEENLDLLTVEANSTLGSYRSLAGNADQTITTLRGDLRELVSTLQTASNSFSGAMSELQAIAQENRQPIADFAGTGLYELTNFLIEARTLVKELSRVTTEVERDPARFFFGDSQQGYETKQR